MQTKNPGPATPQRLASSRKSRQIKHTSVSRTVSRENGRAKGMDLDRLQIDVEFKLIASEAGSVSVAGNFNNWDAKKAPLRRSEERRVGKECRSRWSPYH